MENFPCILNVSSKIEKLLTMLTFHKLLKLHGVEPAKVKLVRHGNKEIQILETFQQNISKFVTYQSFQNPNKFGKAKYIAVFAPYHKTTALFLGLWEIDGIVKNNQFTSEISQELINNNLPQYWYKSSDRYILKENK